MILIGENGVDWKGEKKNKGVQLGPFKKAAKEGLSRDRAIFKPRAW